MMFIQDILNIGTVVLMIIIIELFNKQQREIQIICDEQNVTACDYGAVVEYIPTEYKDIDIIDEIKHAFHVQGYDLTSVSLVFDLTELNQLDKEMMVLVKKKEVCLEYLEKLNIIPKEFIKEGEELTPEENMENLEKEMDAIRIRIKEYYEKCEQGMVEYFIGKAYITFESEKLKNKCIDNH